MRFSILYIPILAAALLAPCSYGQADSLSSSSVLGAQVVLTNSGFGLGGYTTFTLRENLSLHADISIGAVKDEREVAFFDRFGQRDVPNKANYLLEIPIQIGVQKRIFHSKIEDNFRPFFQASLGPVIGWKYPYYDDENGNGVYDTDEPTFDVLSGLSNGSVVPGFGVGLFVGAHFGSNANESRGIRFGYRTAIYREKIALLEPSIKAPSRRIGSPVIMVYFGRSAR